jgi:16S rRNA (cytosine1402-N4)-methyltransferase
VSHHISVLLEEAVDGLAPLAGRRFVDGTAGGGGHAARVLSMNPQAEVLAIDRDPEAVARVTRRLAEFGSRAHVRLGRFAEWRDLAAELGWTEVDGILLDLGFSSYQMDEAERGFSFSRSGPLDMRMDPGSGVSAAELLNTSAPQELVRIFREFGEEPEASRIVTEIVKARPLFTTGELGEVVSAAVSARRRRERIHPATLVFQALRIVVNDELGELDRFLEQLPEGLAPGGRVAIISFHSLEDQRVKRRFKELAVGCICPPKLPICSCGHAAQMRPIKNKAIRPSEAETALNPRARSARLRVAART